MNLRTVLHTLVLSSGILAAVRGPAAVPAASPVSVDEPLRYGRISGDGTKVYNLKDEKGKVVAEPAAKQIVAVYKEDPTGWLEVEIPGGFAVWVFGRFLKETGEPGLYEVTGNAVNLRPAPSSDVTNFPLPQRLQAGDRVRGIELLDADKPLAETWVRIWSPPGVRACVRSSAVAELEAGADGAGLWESALAALPARPLPRASTARGVEPSEAERREAEARKQLEATRTALEAERVKDTPDYAPIEAQLSTIAAQGGPVALEARAELRALGTLKEAAALKADLEREKQRLAEEALRDQQRVWEKSRDKDPLGGIFLARGTVVRRTLADGTARYYINFGQVPTCELVCTSGRYDLGAFAGTEIGVQGSEVTSRTGELPTYEALRIEVLAVR